MMRFPILCLAILAFVAISVGQATDEDPYYLRVVKNALAMRSGNQIVIQSWSQKQLARLGDGVSIALLKILDEQDLANPQTIRAMLPIIRDSFVEPQFIAIEENRNPRITLFLLSCLQRSILDTPTRRPSNKQ